MPGERSGGGHRARRARHELPGAPTPASGASTKNTAIHPKARHRFHDIRSRYVLPPAALRRGTAAAGPLPGDGRAQRDPGLVLRRRAGTSTRRWRSSTGGSSSPTGADLVDVGGESTRPGAPAAEPAGGARPGAAGGRRRWPPRGSAVSVDTMRAEVAEAAVAAGAVLVNDVSGGLADDEMLPTVAPARDALRADALAGALRGRCSSTRRTATWSPTWSPSCASQLDAALGGRGRSRRGSRSTRASGSPRPPTRTGTCSAGTERLHDLGHPVLVATSRKRFLGTLLADEAGELRPPELREDATTATSALAAASAGLVHPHPPGAAPPWTRCGWRGRWAGARGRRG